jgi:hypothetical protein
VFRAYYRVMVCAGVAAVNMETLLETLADLLRELGAAAENGEVGWLRPLAVLTAEIEFSLLRPSKLAAASVADECRELTGLLNGSSGSHAEFGARYASLRRASSRLAELHERALSASQAMAGPRSSGDTPVHATCGSDGLTRN